MFLSIYLEDFERWAGDVVEGAQVLFDPSGLLVLAATPKPTTPEIIIKGMLILKQKYCRPQGQKEKGNALKEKKIFEPPPPSPSPHDVKK